MANNSPNTTSAIADDTIINVNALDLYATWSGGAAFHADPNNNGVDNSVNFAITPGGDDFIRMVADIPAPGTRRCARLMVVTTP